MMVQMMDYNRQILLGDVLDKLKEIPDNTFDCIISSPPYWSLRDYGIKGQLGLEPNFIDYLKIMSHIMNELKRVLKSTGSCWINLGDCYGSSKGDNSLDKSRLGIPERFYINCIDSGWIARNHISWYKSNSMPQSVKDRLSNKWESIFFFVKEQKYYFNLNAIREKSITQSKPFNIRVREIFNGKGQQKMGNFSCLSNDKELSKYNKDGTKKQDTITEKYDKDSNVGRLHKDRKGNPNKQDNTLGADSKPKANYAGFNDRWKNKTTWNLQDIKQLTNIPLDNLSVNDMCALIHIDPNEICSCGRLYKRHVTTTRGKSSHENYPVFTKCNDMGKNPGDVFFINPKPFSESHFATFPIELPEYILKCACPQQVCAKCGTPRYPISKPTEEYAKYKEQKNWSNEKYNNQALKQGKGILKKDGAITAEYQTTGYTKCDCNKEFIPGICLDPFMGSGTTALAAEQAGLRWCGIELKEEYTKIAKKRLESYIKQERIA